MLHHQLYSAHDDPTGSQFLLVGAFLKACLKSQKCGGHSWLRTNAMPPDRRSPQDAFYIDMLDPRVLGTPDELNTALRAIEAVCHRGDLEIAEMIAALDSRPHLLEYIISSTLHVSALGPCLLPALIILSSSARGRSLREALEVDTSYRISRVHNAKHDGHYEHAAPREILIFVAIR